MLAQRPIWRPSPGLAGGSRFAATSETHVRESALLAALVGLSCFQPDGEMRGHMLGETLTSQVAIPSPGWSWGPVAFSLALRVRALFATDVGPGRAHLRDDTWWLGAMNWWEWGGFQRWTSPAAVSWHGSGGRERGS